MASKTGLNVSCAFLNKYCVFSKHVLMLSLGELELEDILFFYSFNRRMFVVNNYDHQGIKKKMTKEYDKVKP